VQLVCELDRLLRQQCAPEVGNYQQSLLESWEGFRDWSFFREEDFDKDFERLRLLLQGPLVLKRSSGVGLALQRKRALLTFALRYSDSAGWRAGWPIGGRVLALCTEPGEQELIQQRMGASLTPQGECFERHTRAVGIRTWTKKFVRVGKHRTNGGATTNCLLMWKSVADCAAYDDPRGSSIWDLENYTIFDVAEENFLMQGTCMVQALIYMFSLTIQNMVRAML
jgi:hypothetical protein